MRQAAHTERSLAVIACFGPKERDVLYFYYQTMLEPKLKDQLDTILSYLDPVVFTAAILEKSVHSIVIRL
jgi:hypothetical protein